MPGTILKLLAGVAMIAYAWWRRHRRPDVDLHGDRFWTWQTYAGSIVIALFGVACIASGVADLL